MEDVHDEIVNRLSLGSAGGLPDSGAILSPSYVRNYKGTPSLPYLSTIHLLDEPILLSTTATFHPHPLPKMPGVVVGNATKIWEVGVHWSLYSQCGIWDPRGRGVDIWECICDRKK